MNKSELKRLIVEFHEYKLPDSIERDIDIDMSTDKVITLVGPRRAGKTYLLYNLIKHLEASGVDRRDMIMINFEDPLVYPFTARDPTIEIYHWKPPGTETDFIIKRGPIIEEAIQVAWDVEDPKTRKREEYGLRDAMKQFGLNHGIIITADHEGKSDSEGAVIEYIPLWQWMLSM